VNKDFHQDLSWCFHRRPISETDTQSIACRILTRSKAVFNDTQHNFTVVVDFKAKTIYSDIPNHFGTFDFSSADNISSLETYLSKIYGMPEDLLRTLTNDANITRVIKSATTLKEKLKFHYFVKPTRASSAKPTD